MIFIIVNPDFIVIVPIFTALTFICKFVAPPPP